MFNLSVLVTDAFMAAVKADAAWQLTFGGTTYKVRRRASCGTRIMRATYDYAEPGVIFIDRINRLQQSLLIARRSTPPTRAASSRCRPTAPACWARSTWRALVQRAVHRPARSSTRPSLPAWCRSPCACWTMSSTSRAFRCRQQRQEAQGQAAHRPRRHRPRRRADPLRRALWLGRGGRADRELAAGDRSARPISPRPSWPRRRAPSRCSTARNISPARRIAALDADVRDAIAAHGIRNALLTSIAPTGTISLLRRQCLVRASSRCSASRYTPQRADARRHRAARKR